MIKSTIQNINLLQILDEATDQVTYGCNQEWFSSKWKRMSGCGPSVATNIFLYFELLLAQSPAMLTRQECQKRMDEVWKYITPSFQGVSSTRMITDGAMAYAKAKSLQIETNSLNIPRKIAQRPSLRTVITFIDTALRANVPVAFLNLHNGNIANLDTWHWVTIVSLEYDEAYLGAQCVIIDEGATIEIALAKWIENTKLGGGFVSLIPKS